MTKIKKVADETIKRYCPCEFGLDGEKSHTTESFDENDVTTGWRGITCVECWNKEVI